jgi:hypothetical protein
MEHDEVGYRLFGEALAALALDASAAAVRGYGLGE